MTQRRKYQHYHPYFITTNVQKRSSLFEVKEYAQLLSNTIIRVCNSLNCKLYGFCIMPDHVHLLLLTNKENNISTVMQQIKSLTAKAMRERLGFKEKFWQPRFNHQIIDTSNGIAGTITYIKNNYIKWDLDKKYSKMPYLYINP
jgi:putative transposase